jgi:hypothetical protein
MTTKKRHNAMRKDKPVRLTAKRRPGVKTVAHKVRATRTTLRDVARAAHDAGLRVEVDLKRSLFDIAFPPASVTGMSRETIQTEIDAGARSLDFDATTSADVARRIGEQISANFRDETRPAPSVAIHGLCKMRAAGDPNCDTTDCCVEIGKRAHEVAQKIIRNFTLGDGTYYQPGYRVDGYQSLEEILYRAYQQAATGKGAERHGRGEAFDGQPTQVISDLLDSDAGLAFQAIKKVNEGMRLEHGAKIKEMLGAINYIASIVIRMERNKK